VLDVTESLIRQAARAVESHRLRAFDALHLAAATLFRGQIGEPLVFATWDGNLRKVAARERLEPLKN
jgi:predicted nucleic acid-binding protein